MIRWLFFCTAGELVTSIGKVHNVTGAQVALRWVVQQGIPVIPKATNKAFLEQDFDLFSFSLTEQQMAALTAANSPPQTGTPPQKPDDDQDCAVP